jgi:hypothetical protein
MYGVLICGEWAPFVSNLETKLKHTSLLLNWNNMRPKDRPFYNLVNNKLSKNCVRKRRIHFWVK